MEYNLEDFLNIIGEMAKDKALMQATINNLKRENGELKEKLEMTENEKSLLETSTKEVE